LANVTIDINARVDNLQRQLANVTQDLNRFSQNASGIGGILQGAFSELASAATLAGFGALIKGAIDTGDRLKDLSKTTGLAVEQLAGLKFAAGQSGSDLEATANAINKLSQNIGKNGDKFKQLGIDAKDPLEAFKQLADIFVSIEEPQQKAALAAAALGKSWQEVAPLLAEGGKALGEMVKQGTEASGVTEDFANKSDQLNDTIGLLTTKFQGLGVTLAGPILDAMLALSTYIQNVNSSASEGSRAFDLFKFGIDGAAKVTAAAIDIFHRASLGIGALLDKAAALASLDFNQFLKVDQRFSQDIQKASSDYAKLVDQIDNGVKKTGTQGISNKDALDQAAKAVENQKRVSAFLGTTKVSSPRSVRIPRTRSASTSRKTTIDEGARVIEQLKREIALLGDGSRIAAAKYDTQNGALSKISEKQKAQIVFLNQEIEANKRQQAQWDQLVSDANEYYDIGKKIDDLSIDPDINLDSFNNAIQELRSKLDEGIINESQFNTQATKLSKGFNENFVSKAVTDLDQLSAFGQRAAQNIQDSFADFLFDPFKNGIDGMLVGFLNFIRKAAAEAASSQIFDALNGAVKDAGGYGKLLGKAGSFVANLFHDGGEVGSSGGTARAVNPGVFLGAKKYHDGGFAGLNPDEIPAILQRGEIVLSKRQVSAAKNYGGGGQPMVVNNHFSVTGEQTRQSQLQIAAAAGQGIQRALLRTS
jgi:hypothetical protein